MNIMSLLKQTEKAVEKSMRVIIIVWSFSLFSCNSDKGQIIKFAEDFSDAIARHDTTTIRKMYPDAIKADSLFFAFNHDSITIEKSEDIFKVKFGSNILAEMKKDSEGKYSITKSKGIFYFRPKLIQFAKNVGLIDDELSDNQINERLSDSLFVNYLTPKTIEQLSRKVYIDRISDNRSQFSSDGTGPGDWFITIINNFDKDFMGKDYEIEIKSRVRDSYVRILDGEDIYARASVELQTHLDGMWYCSSSEWGLQYEIDPSIRLVYKINNLESISRYYQPQGNEYQDYLND